MSETKLDKAAIANAWLTSPVVVYTIVAIVAGGALLWLVPSLFKGAKEGFNTVVDDVRGGIGSILGQPESQQPAERSATDTVRGVFVEEDRALSDIWDATLGRVFN